MLSCIVTFVTTFLWFIQSVLRFLICVFVSKTFCWWGFVDTVIDLDWNGKWFFFGFAVCLCKRNRTKGTFASINSWLLLIKVFVKGIVHPDRKLCHPQVAPNLFFFSVFFILWKSMGSWLVTNILQNIFCVKQKKKKNHTVWINLRMSINDGVIFIFGWTIPLNLGIG